MGSKKISALLVLILSCSATLPAIDYPDFIDAPMQSQINPYLLPLDHPMKATLDSIFSKSRVLENEKSLLDAGFVIIAGPRPISFVIVARHPEIPGYVFKLNLDSEKRLRKNIPHWKWLAQRCAGAEGIRKIIKRKKIRHFTVPDKWLYVLPVYPYASVLTPEPVVLMETDMQLEPKPVTEHKWKNVKREHLDELYAIIKHGYGGSSVLNLAANVPYTKSGKFAFTDTEDPQKQINLKQARKYLSKEMQLYWDSLIQK